MQLTATPLFSDSRVRDSDFDSEWNRLMTIYNNRDWQIGNPDLAQAWTGIQENAYKSLKLLAAIAQIDNRKPSGWDIFVKALPSNPTQEQKDEFNQAIVLRGLAELGKLGLQSQFRDSERTLDTSIAALQSVAGNLAQYRLPDAIGVQYYPSWKGTFDSDQVILQNNSGFDLVNASVVVVVHFGDGNSIVHMHTVDRWNAGATLRALYSYESTDYEYAGTGTHPDSVDVSVYFPTESGLEIANATYSLSPAVWDHIVEDYCSRIKVNGNYLGAYPDSETQEHHPAGFQLQFSGLSKLPITALQIRFTTQDGSTQTQSWTYDPDSTLRPSEVYPFRSSRLDGDIPAHIDLLFSVPEASYQPWIHIY